MTAKEFWQRSAIRAGLMAGALAGRPIRGEDGPMDPVMSALMRAIRRMTPPSVDTSGKASGMLTEMRAKYEQAVRITGLRPPPGVQASNETADGVPIRRYLPPGPALGTLLYFHGGGFALGSLDTHDRLCRVLAARCALRVVSAAYRLAPEHRFPAAAEDAAATLGWLARTEPGPLAVGGDSAGAQLAVVALAAHPQIPVRAHLLLYPVVDMVGGFRSEALFGEGFLLTVPIMQALLAAYVPTGVDRAGPLLSPLRACLPAVPGVVVAAGFDPLRDQARAYAAALERTGVPTHLLDEPGLIHGFADFAGVVPEAHRAVWRAADALRSLMDAC